MTGSPACQRFEIPNKHGCLPPSGCAYPRNKKEPKIAVGYQSTGPFAAALLVNDEQLMEILSDITSRSATLKAWFALRLKTTGTKIKAPEWGLIWTLLQSKGAAWIAQYRRGDFQAIQWELQEPTSKIDLWACTVCVLYCNVHETSGVDEGDDHAYRWHDYYYETEGKYFLLYSLLKCCTCVMSHNRSNTLFRPRSLKGLPRWRETCGGRIAMAAEGFMDDTLWDPLQMKLKHTFSKRLDRSESTDPEDDKSIVFVLASVANPQMFRRDSNDIPRDAGDDSNMQDIPTAVLGTTIVSVSHVFDNKAIDTLDEFWEVADLTEEPFFWLRCTSDYTDSDQSSVTLQAAIPGQQFESSFSTPRDTDQSSITEPGSPNHFDYSNHAILELESELEKAAEETQVRWAQLRFGLIRENYRCSAYMVEDLKEFFAELEQTTTEAWQRLSERKESVRKMCENATADLSQDNELSDMIAELSMEQRNHAKMYVPLIKSNNPLAEHATKELVKLLMPDAAEWEEVLRKKRIFDEIKGDGTESDEATIQS